MNQEIENRGCATEAFGRKWLTCRICGEHANNNIYKVKEMMYGTKEEFNYFVCEKCKCMQIEEVPENLEQYYHNYYSMRKEGEKEFREKAVHVQEKILDVGCGTGGYLLEMAEEGYGNLYGCDPYIEGDIRYGDRIFIKKGTIDKMEGVFDRIRFGDCFEHIENPLETLRCVKRKLKPEGVCQMTMPVFPNAAFDTFGINWYQLDAPRHICLYSEEGMKYLCDKCGLMVERVEYNSNLYQFIVSYCYELGISLKEFEIERNYILGQLGEEMVEYFKMASERVNKKKYGDHAQFTIRHA